MNPALAPLPPVGHPAAASLAARWLLLATAAVAGSSLFAILIVLARVPGIGTWFPGTEFYRVALTLHVNLSQWVWFMAFASVLWRVAQPQAPGALSRSLLWLASAGTLLMAITPALGAVPPIMSNYLPVLDSPWFLLGLVAYGLAIAGNAMTALVQLVRHWAAVHECNGVDPVWRLALGLAAAVVVVALGVLVMTGLRLRGIDGIAYFEQLFWGPGHLWQYCLVLLMMLCWLAICRDTSLWPRRGWIHGALVMTAAPALLAPVVLPFAPQTATYAQAMTWLMQWTTWPGAALLAALLVAAHARHRMPLPAGMLFSLFLLAYGILLGTRIDGQNTIVTAHYHGTIGAVTVAFMALSYRMLPVLGFVRPAAQPMRVQLLFYSAGIVLMMSGLAVAGQFGAPRKMAGNVGVEWGAEMVARGVMGVGGLLATVGILMYLILVAKRLGGGRQLLATQHG